MPKTYSFRGVARLLGVSKYSVRKWFLDGLFGQPAKQRATEKRSASSARIAATAIVAFCREHPDKINTRKCDPDLLLLMEDEDVQPNAWQGPRQHLTKQRQCPGCRRVVRGNAYFRHVKRCGGGRASASGTESQSATTG